MAYIRQIAGEKDGRLLRGLRQHQVPQSVAALYLTHLLRFYPGARGSADNAWRRAVHGAAGAPRIALIPVRGQPTRAPVGTQLAPMEFR